MFRKLLIANRGEIARRILRSASEMGIETVVAYSEADSHSPYLKEADDSICIGPGPSSESYLNMEALLQAALQKECQALHPGYGFLSENARFAFRCEQQRLSFVGPPPGAIARMGNKIAAKGAMSEHGLPILSGKLERLVDVDEAVEIAVEVGYPVLLKASSGGGGRGMKLAHNEGELRQNFDMASQEALQAFGDGSLYLEKYLSSAKHIEFQIIGDKFGNAVHLGERECSIQRRHQKLIEEAPSPVIDDRIRQEFGHLVAQALAEVGYYNAGTVEFLRAPSGDLYFMEVNARLQVEHPVSEMITGKDLVAEQLRVAAGNRLSFTQDDIDFQGHAIECRINAEDPEKDFQPSPGTITAFEPPQGEGIRLDTHVEKGYQIPPYYDSMIAKLIVHGKDRQEALDRMDRALGEFKIEGVTTTIPFLKKVINYEEFQQGTYDIHTLERI